uniref:Uncharacterized protein n=1 Tax=Anopheles coluzzii TaxID=1518534 RepID=A0A8W7PIB0_ANOCL
MRVHLPVRTEIRWAIMRPPITASPVQIECPMMPPAITPYTFSRALSMTVVSWDRSPHSATNVIVNACMKMRSSSFSALLLLLRPRPVPRRPLVEAPDSASWDIRLPPAFASRSSCVRGEWGKIREMGVNGML